MTTATLPSLTGITYLQSAEVVYGQDIKDASELQDWHKDSNPWTITLTTELATHAFPFWTGEAVKDEPTVADLIYCLVMDSLHLEQEPEEVSYPVGCSIKDNDRKMRELFGSYWDTLRAMDEDEIFEVF